MYSYTIHRHTHTHCALSFLSQLFRNFLDLILGANFFLTSSLFGNELSKNKRAEEDICSQDEQDSKKTLHLFLQALASCPM